VNGLALRVRNIPDNVGHLTKRIRSLGRMKIEFIRHDCSQYAEAFKYFAGSPDMETYSKCFADQLLAKYLRS
jgi:hypothetical protein